MSGKSFVKFIFSCLFTTIIACSLVTIPAFLISSTSSEDNNAVGTAARQIDEKEIKAEVIKEMGYKIKDDIAVFSSNTCFKKTYYISHDGVKMYSDIGDDKSVKKCLDNNSEVVAYKENNDYIYCEDSTGAKGWIKKDSNDLKSMVFNKAKYLIDVNISKQSIDIYSNGKIMRKNILCSSGVIGKADTETPCGIFSVKNKVNYPTGVLQIDNNGVKQTVMYPTQFFGNYLIHSVPIDEIKNNGKIVIESKEEKDKLGKAASHGCIRVSLEDAKWIYTNISKDAQVYIHY